MNKNSIFVKNLDLMKRFFGLLSLCLLINSCDEGTISLQKFDFDSAAAVEDCETNNGLFFKLKGIEALLLQIPITAFKNEVTVVNSPRTFVINGTNRVLYRLFDSTISDAYFCSVIPPSTPIVTEEWIAKNGVSGVSGEVKITTTAIINPTTGILTGYNHKIVFTNITFEKGSDSFVYEEYIFGNYVTAI